MHLYGDLLSENFHATITVVLVAHLTVKFFGTSGEKYRRHNFRTQEWRAKAKIRKIGGENEQFVKSQTVADLLQKVSTS